jgi:hypothetical protein
MGNSGYDQDFYSGTVIYGVHLLYFWTKINKNWIAAVVNENENFDNVCWGIQSIEDTGDSNQSQAVRTYLLKKIKLLFFSGILQAECVIGYPVILKDTQNITIPASLVHDDHFVAYSFQMKTYILPYPTYLLVMLIPLAITM